MLNLFNKSRVKAGKQAQIAKSSDKKESPLMALKSSWKKLNSMDRKQAYTWGAVVLVGLVALMLLGSAASNNPEDFTEYESRGYDLANMPFSSDEAEQYLLASKYPDMNGQTGGGLYSAEEKAARQAADEEEEEENFSGQNGNYQDANYRGNSGGRYGGGSGRRGSGPKTQVGQLSSANLKGANGSAVGGTFGPRGDFSNFKSQNKGSDKAPTGPGSGSARKALFQTAQGSRAAAGIKDNRLMNAKKAMMGGNIEGSKAFTDNGVDLSKASGLNLDTNAPIATPGLQDLDDKLNDAKKKAEDDDKNADDENEKEWWQSLLEGLAEKAIDMGLRIAEQAIGNAMADARVERQAKEAAFSEATSQVTKQYEQQAAAIENYQAELKQYDKDMMNYTSQKAAYDAYTDRALDYFLEHGTPLSEVAPPKPGDPPQKPSAPTATLNVGGEQVTVNLGERPTDPAVLDKWDTMLSTDKAKWLVNNGSSSGSLNSAVTSYAKNRTINNSYGGFRNNTSSSYDDQIQVGGVTVFGKLNRDGTLTTQDGRRFRNTTGNADNPNWAQM